MEDKKPDYNFSKRPLNFRPKPEQKEFIIALLEANAGSQQKALEHCVTLAMDPTKTITVTKEGGNSAELDRLKKDIAVMSKSLNDDTALIDKLNDEIRALKSAQPKPVPSGGLTLSDAAKAVLEKIRKAKKFGTIDEVIVYALNYTSKNDWL